MKKLILIASVFLSTIFSASAGDEFKACKSISFSGEESVCVGESAGYSMGDRGTHGVSWTVTNGAEILTASNIDMVKLRNTLGIPADAKIIYLHANNKLFDVSFDFGITATAQYSTGSVFTYNIKGSSALGIRKNPTGESAKDIQVKFNTLGSSYVGVNVAGVGNRGACADNRGVNVSVTGADLDKFNSLTLSGAQANNIGCSQYVTFATPWFPSNGSTKYEWTVSPNTANIVGPTTNNQLQISSFNNPGSYRVSLTVISCGGKSKTVSKTVTVGTPNPDLRVNNSVFTDLEYKPSCTDANNGFNLSSEPWLSNSALYTWTLPAGWIISGQVPSTTKIDPDGAPIYSYQGVNLRYLRILQSHPAAKSGDIIMKVNNFCGSSYSVSKVMKIVAPLQLSVLLSSNNVTCDNSLTLNPIVSGGISGNSYKVQWSTTGVVGKFLKGNTFNTTTDFSNTFLAEQYGNGTAKVYISGNDGCAGTAIANISMYGGNIATDPNISGWLSGHINPDLRADVASNVVKAPDYNRIYFVRRFSNNTREVYYYDFDLQINKWVLKPTGITDLATSGDNILYYLKSGTVNDVLYTVNASGFLKPNAIDRVTGKSVGNTELTEIKVYEQNYGYSVTDINGTLARVMWKDEFGTLYSGTILFDPYKIGIDPKIFKFNTAAKVTVVANGGYNPETGIVRYDVDKVKNRVFYFKADGGFYTKKLDNLTVETKLNGVLNDDQVWNVTDLVFDNDGNVYFTANGDIFFVHFDYNENYLGTYKIETTDNVLTDQLKSGAKGYLGINQSTGVVYYAGYNNNVYQLYRNTDFATSKKFTVVRATPPSFYDNISNSLVYAEPHLYYRSTDNQLYNLFFISIPGVIECKPKWMRQANVFDENESSVSATRVENVNSTLQGSVFPNPAHNSITVDVWGADAKEGKLEIYNLQGLQIHQEFYNFQPKDIDLSDLESGMYIVKVKGSDKQIISFKVVKH